MKHEHRRSQLSEAHVCYERSRAAPVPFISDDTVMCLVVTGASGETAVVPAEPGPPEQRGGGGVPRLLLRENSRHESGPGSAREVLLTHARDYCETF